MFPSTSSREASGLSGKQNCFSGSDIKCIRKHSIGNVEKVVNNKKCALPLSFKEALATTTTATRTAKKQ